MTDLSTSSSWDDASPVSFFSGIKMLEQTGACHDALSSFHCDSCDFAADTRRELVRHLDQHNMIQCTLSKPSHSSLPTVHVHMKTVKKESESFLGKDQCIARAFSNSMTDVTTMHLDNHEHLGILFGSASNMISKSDRMIQADAFTSSTTLNKTGRTSESSHSEKEQNTHQVKLLSSFNGISTDVKIEMDFTEENPNFANTCSFFSKEKTDGLCLSSIVKAEPAEETSDETGCRVFSMSLSNQESIQTTRYSCDRHFHLSVPQLLVQNNCTEVDNDAELKPFSDFRSSVHEKTITNCIPSRSEGDVILINSSVDDVVAGNTNTEFDIARTPVDDCNFSSEKRTRDNFSQDTHMCPICKMVFSASLYAKSHMDHCHTGRYSDEINDGKRKLNRNDCIENFRSVESLYAHMRTHERDMLLNCDECHISFKSSRDFHKHMRTHGGEMPFKCDECDLRFDRYSNLHKHTSRHNGVKPYKCTECDKNYSDNSSLYMHMRTHKGEKPFKCKECDKSFYRNSYLQKHTRTHTGEKPFICNECGKCFQQCSHLQKHLSIHTGEKPFGCNYCSMSFSDKYRFRRHTRIHTGEKPFQCIECGKSFSDNSSLRRHMKTQKCGKEKPFKCNECNTSFSWHTQLHTHLANHTGEKQLECSRCHKIFPDKQVNGIIVPLP